MFLERLRGHAIVDGERRRFMASVGLIGLNGVDEGTELRGQAFFDAALGPVNAKVPIPWSRSRALILLKDGCIDASLKVVSGGLIQFPRGQRVVAAPS